MFLSRNVIFFLNLNPNERIIIIGGGSGKVLESINQLNIPLTIDFIEPSTRMIEKARERIQESSNLSVNFHKIEFESYKSSEKYDWVCCFFFLDLFNKSQSLHMHLDHIKSLMDIRSNLLVSDFEINKDSWWKKLLSYFMHLFFKATTGLESNGTKRYRWNGHELWVS